MNTNNIGLPSLALAQQISDRFINLVDVRKDRFNILSFIVKLSFQSQCILTDADLARMRLPSLIQSKAIDSTQKQKLPQKKKRRKKKKHKYVVSGGNRVTHIDTHFDVQRYLEHARWIVKNSEKQAAPQSNEFMNWKVKLKGWYFQAGVYLRNKVRKWKNTFHKSK